MNYTELMNILLLDNFFDIVIIFGIGMILGAVSVTIIYQVAWYQNMEKIRKENYK